MDINVNKVDDTMAGLLTNKSRPALRGIDPANGEVEMWKGYYVDAEALSPTSTSLGYIRLMYGKSEQAKVGYMFLDGCALRLNDLYCSDHRAVLQNTKWQKIYGQHTGALSYMKSDGKIVSENDTCYPCHNCGVILPERFIQIDHHHPQSYGEGMAVLKAFRAIGLTVGGPSGGKNRQLSSSASVAASSLAFIPPKGNKPGQFTGSSAASFDRYRLSENGHIFLTVLAVAKQIDALKSVCMNSLVNLVPLCPTCNGSAGKGKGVKPIRF